MSRHKNNRRKKGTEKISDILLWNISLKEGDGHLRTAANYRSCMNKAGAYLGKDFRHFTFPELTARWVKGYVNWLKRLHPGSPNTVEFYLRGLRAMCRNYREKHRLAWSEGSDPFSGVPFVRSLPPSAPSRPDCFPGCSPPSSVNGSTRADASRLTCCTSSSSCAAWSFRTYGTCATT